MQLSEIDINLKTIQNLSRLGIIYNKSEELHKHVKVKSTKKHAESLIMHRVEILQYVFTL